MLYVLADAYCIRHVSCLFISSVFWQIVQIAKPIILDWMIDQLEQTSEWTRRAFKLEVAYLQSDFLLFLIFFFMFKGNMYKKKKKA